MRLFRASLIVLGLLVLSCGVPAYAQKGSDEGSKVDLFGGVSFLENQYPSVACCGGNYTIKGFHIQGTYNLTKHLGFMADFSRHSNTSDERSTNTSNGNFETLHVDQSMRTIAFGPAFSVEAGKMRLSAHTLAGFSTGELTSHRAGTYWGSPFDYLYTYPSNTGMAFVLGGSADYMFKPRWGWRIAQVDYVHSTLQACETGLQPGNIYTPGTGCDYGVKNLRLSTGLVFRLGGK